MLRLPLFLVLVLVLVAGCGDDPAAVDDDPPAPEDTDETDEPDPQDDPDPEPEQVEGGELVFALPDDPDVLDPTQGRTLVGRMVFVNMCEALYDVDSSLEVVPRLAADLPDFSDDGLTAQIAVREGVTFQDGTPLDAEAVKISLDRHQTMEGSARASDLGPIEEVVVVDPMTVELRLSEPLAPLAAILTDRGGIVMSPAQLDALGDDFGQEPVCVGPFQFVERGNDRIVLERAEDYYDAHLVQLDRVVFQAINDGNIRTANLRSGDVHMAERIPTTDLDQLESDPNLTVHAAASLGYWGLTVNLGNVDGMDAGPGEAAHPLASDPQVREALDLTLDRELINEVVFNGAFTPGCTPITPGTPYAPDIACPERDLDRAAELVAEAGLDAPVPVQLLARTDPENLRLAELVQSMASEGPFDVTVNSVEFVTGQEQAIDGDFELYHAGWSGRLDPDGNIYGFHHTSGSFNYGQASDESIDGLLDEARRVTDEDARRDLYGQAIELIVERRNIIYLYHPNVFVAGSTSVTGFEFYGDWLPRLKTAALSD